MANEETVVTDTESLDDFSTSFFGKEQVAPVVEPEATPEETQEPEVTADTEDEDLETSTEADDPELNEETDEEVESDKFKLKRKKTVQERINEVTAEKYEAIRKAEDAERRLQEALAKIEQAPKEQKTTEPTDGPDPNAFDAEGNAIYPLGEFDPNFIRDLTRHTFEQEKAKAALADAEATAQNQAAAAKAELQTQFLEKVETVKEHLPDLPVKAIALEETLSFADPALLEYFASTIMSLEHGPEVLYYLSDNLDEARKIVQSGTVRATLSLGELNAQFKGKQKQQVKVTKAPEPPEVRLRGSTGKFTVAPDTDDLTAFEQTFFSK